MGSAWQGYAKRNGDKMTLVGYYPLDEDSGTTAYDYSGNENHGTANGAGPSGTGTVAGPLNASAYEFDGTDDEVTYSNSLQNSSAQSVTVSAWVNLDTFTTRAGILAEYDSSINNSSYSLWVESSTGTVRWQQRNSSGGNMYAISNTSLTTGSWYHLVGITDVQVPELRLYIDGTENTTGTYDGTSPKGTFEFNKIGFESGNSEYTDGAISDVRIYDRALSPQEIAYLYQVGQEAHIRTEVKSV